MTEQANLLLGADLMISGDRPLPDTFTREAERRGLAALPVIRFNSMVQAAAPGADGAVLSDVKAVTAGYPLRGAITVPDAALPEGRPVTGVPKRGEVWIDARLAQRLGASVGTKLAVGETTLTVTTIFAQEPGNRRIIVRARPEAAPQFRRRSGDEPAAAGQSCDVATAGRRAGRTRGRRLSRMARVRDDGGASA